jgi:hypothetical protein
VKNGRFHITAEDDSGKTATMQFGGSAAGSIPSWIPSYPGSSPQMTFSGAGGEGNGGNFSFSTHDSPAQVIQFYQEKAKDLGLKANVTATAEKGGTLVLADEATQRNLIVVVGKDSGETTVNVTYGTKR